MEFCDICDNLLYLRAEQETTLTKYCKHCSFSKKENSAPGNAIKVTQTLYSEDDLLYLQFKNKYLRNDPTLPRVRDPALACPQSSCPGPKDQPQVLYIKYHPIHMKYLYCCDYCGHMWRQEEKMM
jgi:DNA-directed RNA polymerase subunit M/transcription elongation factor TFIIS